MSNSVCLPRWREDRWVVVALALYAAITFFTACRLPIPWNDEVMYADPAVNLVLGKGFRSSAWYAQDAQGFWAGNVPLYALALSVWLKIWGISSFIVRSLSYLLYFGAVGCFWLAVKRAGLLKRPALSGLFMALLLCGYGVNFSFRSARPDALNVLLAAAVVLTSTYEKRALRYPALIVLGALSSAAGLQLVVFLFLIGLLAILFFGKRMIGDALFFVCGAMVGLCLLYIVYSSQGVWNSFVASTIGAHSSAGTQSVWTKLRDSHIQLGGLMRDYSLLVLLGVAGYLGWRSATRKAIVLRSNFVFCACAATLVPLCMFAIGVFPIYYSWMAYFPLCLCVTAELERQLPDAPKISTVLVTSCCLLTACLGMPLLTLVAALDWHDRDPSRVEALVKECVTSRDVVWCAPEAYYPTKKRASVVFCAAYKLATPERNRVSLVIGPPSIAQELSGRFGGNWRECGNSVRPTKPPLLGTQSSVFFRTYDLQAYRRVD
jgi:hypothetical protein